MLVLASLLLAQAAVTLPEFEALPSREAAARALAGQKHGPIDKVERDLTPGGAPGVTEYLIYEQPEPVAGGCRRTKWTTAFARRSGAGEPATLTHAYPTREVGIANGGACDAAAFAHLNPGVDEREALAFLARLQAAASENGDLEFDCESAIDDGLCRTPAAIREALSLTPFAIASAEGTLELWLSRQRGGVVTKVRFDAGRPNTLIVRRVIPAPF